MVRTTTHISILTLAFGLTLAAVPARAQTQTIAANDDSSLVKASGGDSESSSPNDGMKFNTDSAPSNTDFRQPLKFTDPGDTPLGSKAPDFADPAPQEAPFKTYLGYPKNQLGVYVQPMSLSSKWTYGAQDFNFNNSPVALGLDYRLAITPMWKVELDYTHYSMSLPAGTVYPYNIVSSTQSYDTYFVKGRYCFLGSSTFYRQLCPGVDVGNDAYPILAFVQGGSALGLSEVQDITVGANLTYQQPFSDRYLFEFGIGYNYGTGLGNSGVMTSKNNSSYYAKTGIDYNISEHNTIQGEALYLARTAKLSGLQGTNSVTWETDSSLLGVRLGYIRTF